MFGLLAVARAVGAWDKVGICQVCWGFGLVLLYYLLALDLSQS